MVTTDLVASLVVSVIGVLLVWANPRRNVNRAIFATSAVVAGWLACRHMGATTTEHGLFWLRMRFACGALAPLSLWMVKEGVEGSLQLRNADWFKRNAPWFIVSLWLVWVPFTDYFIPSTSTETDRLRGWGYNLYYFGIVCLYGKLLYGSFKSVRHQVGVKKLELQVWLCGGGVVAVSIYGLIALDRLMGNPIFAQMRPLVVLLFYASTAYLITSYRIFDARQIFILGGQKLILVVVASAIAISANYIFSSYLGDVASIIATTAIVLASGAWLSSWLNRQFKFLSKDIEARHAAFAISQRGSRADILERAFLELLKGWARTESVFILTGVKSQFSGKGVNLEHAAAIAPLMELMRWATPERLSRERSSLERDEIAEFLRSNDLGLLVLGQGAAVSVMVGVGIAASRRPYTFPEAEQMIELVAIMQAAFERAHFSTKAQHAEQLATVGVLGASLAHEIRNPLVSIKTFVQLLPTHYQDPTFRSKFFRLISDEVNRMDQLTEQLLDLSSPRAYIAQEVELHPLLLSSVELVSAKASHRHVELLTDLKASPDRAFTDAAAAKQVVLNLCFNAIQAIDGFDCDERWVKISTKNVGLGIEMSVSDSGPGIAPEIRPRLFQPFQTTKSTGFGLGLAICSDILANLSATITVDPAEQGHGATFRVTFPCQPLSS